MQYILMAGCYVLTDYRKLFIMNLNFIECDEGEANYSSLQRTAGRCKAVRG